jgi:8-oxo-dGTP pyrophosphatase MutT (NUDIX family)
MEEFEVTAYGIYAREAVRVEYRPGFALRWDPPARSFIEEAWERYVLESESRGITVYNGTLLGLEHVTSTNGRLLLSLSDVEFKDCIGIAVAGFPAAFPLLYRANPLSVSVTLVTADGKIVVDERSRTDWRRRRYHVIAGFMEQKHDAAAPGPNPFDAIRREVREELALALGPALYATGLVRTATGSELCFSCRLPVSFDEVLAIRKAGPTDHEIETLEAIEDAPPAVASFLAAQGADVVPSGRACILLHGRAAYGEAWYLEATGAADRPSRNLFPADRG